MDQFSVVYIPYPAEARSMVEKAIASWRRFCNLDERLRVQFPYNNASGMGVGYELKKIPGSNRDVKEDFHFTLGSEKWLRDTAWAMKNETMIRFVNDANTLIEILQPFIANFAASLERQFSLKDFKKEVEESKNICFLRFLHYFGGRTVGEEIATSHADKSGFTLHLYESDPGLQYLNLEKKWKDMPVSESQTAIIPGMRMQYRSHNKVKAIYHRVVANEKTAREGRFSIVCFVHLKDTPEYNKKKSGRLQEFQPGFNYEMPFEEFSKLFI